jgi:linoleoyl-CoA desaturase
MDRSKLSMTSPSSTANVAEPKAPKLKFNGSDHFLRELRKRVDAYFERTGRNKRDSVRMYFKTAAILGCFFTAYVLLVFFVSSWWLVLPLAVVLGLATAGIGFNIQHDGGHRAYSDHPWINRLMALTLDLMGGRSYLWDFKHNTFHHTYPNVHGHDDDINLGFLGRLSPEQPRFWFHRFQSLYLWFLYGFIAIKWHLIDDFQQLYVGKIGEHKIPRPKGKDLIVFIAGKVLFFFMAFGLPMMFHKWWAVLGVYVLAAFVSGVVLSVVFQLAHCVAEASFPVPVPVEGGGERIQNEWAIHQVQTTVNFARGNRVLSWFVGGLNFQIEHHLFHKICHVHYPALSKVVEEACREFGIRYNEHKTFFSAVGSHFRWLVEMGRPMPAN